MSCRSARWWCWMAASSPRQTPRRSASYVGLCMPSCWRWRQCLGVERRPSAQLIGLFTPLLSLSLIELFRSGPRVYELEYTREDRVLLNTLAAQVAPALSV